MQTWLMLAQLYRLVHQSIRIIMLRQGLSILLLRIMQRDSSTGHAACSKQEAGCTTIARLIYRRLVESCKHQNVLRSGVISVAAASIFQITFS